MPSEELRNLLVDDELTAIEPLHASFREKRGRGIDDLDEADAVIFGVPFDAGTYKRFGVYEGPIGIRRALEGFRTYSIELGIDFLELIKVTDIGNVAVQNWNSYDGTFDGIAKVIRAVLGNGAFPLMLGGDHSVTYPAVRAFAEHHGEPVGLIWIDNHYDTMPPFRDDPYFCGCPLRHVITSLPELVRPENIVHIGSRGYGNSATSARNAAELGFHIITMSEVDRMGAAATMETALGLVRDSTASFYVTVDIDSADALYAPATQSPRPGGLTSRELMTLVREASLGGAGALDVVEVAPAIDPGGITSLLAAELVLEALGGYAARKRDG